MENLSANLTESFKKKLSLAIEAKGTNAKKLSLDAGLGETAVRDILKDRSGSPKLETIEKLAAALCLNVNDLIEGGSADEWLDKQNILLRELKEGERDRYEEGMKFVFPDKFKGGQE